MEPGGHKKDRATLDITDVTSRVAQDRRRTAQGVVESKKPGSPFMLERAFSSAGGSVVSWSCWAPRRGLVLLGTDERSKRRPSFWGLVVMAHPWVGVLTLKVYHFTLTIKGIDTARQLC